MTALPDWPSPRCTLDWGVSGASRGDITVIVDTLSFATSVATAVDRGAFVYPCTTGSDANAIAALYGAQIAVHRTDVPQRGRYSLSPLTLTSIPPGTHLVLPALNGGRCSLSAARSPYVLAGALINAESVAAALSDLMEKYPRIRITVVPCGERDPEQPDNQIRFAVEDLLGAGAIISYLGCTKSSESLAAEAAFIHLRSRLDNIIFNSISGRELSERGFADDCHYAARLNAVRTVPIFRDGFYQPFRR